MYFRLPYLMLLVAVWPGMSQIAALQAPAGPLSVKQVVENLTRKNLERAQALRGHRGTRTYRLEYRGFPGGRKAEMVVDVEYEAPGRKEFSILSTSGSELIIDRVFKKLLQSEKEALEAENQKHTALNGDNYVFTMVGYETAPSGSRYVLAVEPRTRNKYLYRGRIWVDAEDFAVVRIQAQPAKNPSFWTSRTDIEHVYVKVNEFWLPSRNHTLTSVRLGGHADLTIQYDAYRITSAGGPSRGGDVAAKPSAADGDSSIAGR
jgi:hypothetical protein